MADFSDTIVIVEGVDTDVIGTSDPNLQAGAVKESGQVGFFIVSEIPYSIYFKNNVGLWSATPAVAFTSGTLQKTFAFEWGTNTAFYIKTATSGHKMFAKPSSSNIVVDSDLTDGDFTRTKIVIGNQISTILGDVTGGTVAVLESADESLQTRFSTSTADLGSSVDSLETAVSGEASSRGTAVSSLETRIGDEETATSSINSSVNSLETAVTTEATTRATADSVLDGSVDSLETAISGEASSRGAADTALQASVDSLETAVSSEASSRSTSVSSLDTRIAADEGGMTAVEASVDSLETAISGEAASRGAADTALQASVDSIETKLATIQDAGATLDTFQELVSFVESLDDVDGVEIVNLGLSVDSLETAVTGEASSRTTAVSSLNTRIAADEGDMTAVVASVDSLETAISGEATSRGAADTALQASVDSLETAVSGEASSRTTSVSSLDTRIAADEGDMTAVEASVNSLETAVSGEASSRTTSVSSLDTRIAADEGDMTAVEASVDSLETAVSAIEEASGALTAVTGIANDNLTLGRSDQQDMLDFSTDDRINFKVDNIERFAITNNNRVQIGSTAAPAGSTIPALIIGKNNGSVQGTALFAKASTNKFRVDSEGSKGQPGVIVASGDGAEYAGIQAHSLYLESTGTTVLYAKGGIHTSGSISIDGNILNTDYSNVSGTVADNATAISQIGSDLTTLSGSVSTNASNISSNSTTIASNEGIIEDIRDAVNAAVNGDDLLTKLQAISWPT